MWHWITVHWEFSVSTAAAILLALIGIVVAIVIARSQRPKKSLDYEVMSDIRVIDPQATVLRDDLVVMRGTEQLKDPRVVVVRIFNSGKETVRAADFGKGSEPIQIHYEKNPYWSGGIVNASRNRKVSDAADLSWSPAPPVRGQLNELSITPSQLNSKEWFDIQLLSEGPHGEITADCNFADRTRPMRLADSQRRELSSAASLAAGLALGLCGVAIGVFLNLWWSEPQALPFLVGFIVPTLTAVALMVTLWRARP